MLDILKEEMNMTTTENGALTYTTTGSDCLDLFATIGALRRAQKSEIIARFVRAYTENKNAAMKILFFARDVRGGLGERRVFRTVLNWLCHNEPDSVRKNLAYIAEYGRYDDLLTLIGTPLEAEAVDLIGEALKKDVALMEAGENVSILAKWLPSVNTSSEETVRLARRLARSLGMREAEYRKTLARLRGRIDIIENRLRSGDYSFDYSLQSSRAMLKYRRAFMRKDFVRYEEFISRVATGEARLKTSGIVPYEVIRPLVNPFVNRKERKAIDATWRSLEDFGGDDNALAVIDGSGSMYCCGNPMPATVALSLGIYFAERNQGAFRNHFITFSDRPQLIEIKGEDILDKVRYAMCYSEAANTNIEGVFRVLLDTAVKNAVPESEMPKRLYIISDMEFDSCATRCGKTNFENAKQMYSKAGYRLPEIVFWNVNSYTRQQPVRMNETGVILVSGCTPRLFSMVASGDVTPYKYMLEVIESDRYKPIAA